MNGSKEITNRIYNYLKEKGIIALDLSKPFEERKPEELIVNSMNAHPNKAVHAEVSQLLYRELALWN